MNATPQFPSALAKWILALGWLRHYKFPWLRSDLIASITLSSYLLPATLGDASLARLRAQSLVLRLGGIDRVVTVADVVGIIPP